MTVCKRFSFIIDQTKSTDDGMVNRPGIYTQDSDSCPSVRLHSPDPSSVLQCEEEILMHVLYQRLDLLHPYERCAIAQRRGRCYRVERG